MPSIIFDFSGLSAGIGAEAGTTTGFVAFVPGAGSIAGVPAFLLAAGAAFTGSTFAAGACLGARALAVGALAPDTLDTADLGAGTLAPDTLAVDAFTGAAFGGGAFEGEAALAATGLAAGLIAALASALAGALVGFAVGFAFAGLAFGAGLIGLEGFVRATFFAAERTAFAGFLRAGELWEGLPRSVRFAPAMGEMTLPKALRQVKQWHCNLRRSLGFRDAPAVGERKPHNKRRST